MDGNRLSAAFSIMHTTAQSLFHKGSTFLLSDSHDIGRALIMAGQTQLRPVLSDRA